MTATYLGLPARTVVAVGGLVAVVGVALGLAVPTYGDRVLARCADLNGAALTPEACVAYLAEVDAVDAGDVGDVEMQEWKQGLDTTLLETEIEDMPLDVGDLLGENDQNDPGPDSPNSQIHMLAGDGEFTPDGESMKLKPDPLTGELHFPVVDEESEDKE